MQSQSVENIFARAWSLLTRNPVIIVPGLVVGIIVGIIEGLITPRYGSGDGSGSAAIIGGLGAFVAAGVGIALSVLAYLVTQTYTTGMAGAAWQRGVATLADGAAASFKEDAARLLAAVLLIAVIGIVVGLLTFGLGWFIVLFFALYMIPAVVLDNYGAVPALKLSARIATRRLAPTLIIIAVLVVIGIGVSLLVLPLAFIPFLGPIVVAVFSQAVTAYTTLVIVGEYLSTHRQPDIARGPLA